MNDLMQNPNAIYILGAVLGVAVFFFAYSIAGGVQQLAKETETISSERQGLLLWVSPILRRLTVFTQLVRTEGMDKYRKKLPAMMVQAGLEGFMVAEEYVAFHIFTALAPIPFMAYLTFVVLGQDSTSFVIFSMPLCLLGALYPLYYLRRRITERHKRIFRGLPNVLDLLTVSVEAGLDFMGGLNLVVKQGSPGPLRDELDRMIKQLQLGVSRVDGLRELDLRNGQSDLKSVTAALIQATKLGSSLGPILRIQARTLRERRSQIAEELANKAPVKIIFPIVAFIFPSVFLVLLGPVLIKTYYEL